MKDEKLTKSNIDKDCQLILEAISRLKDGTWNLDKQDEDSDWANYLLPKVKEALQEHIEFESRSILPSLPAKESLEHSNDHKKIIELLENLESLLKDNDAAKFQTSLNLLIKTLENHHNVFNSAIHSHMASCGHHFEGDEIVQRSKSPNLGYK